MSEITRRELLEIAAATAISGGVTARSEAAESRPDLKRELYTRGPIELYTGTLSAAPGETVTLHVSSTAKRYHLQIARVGAPNKVVWTRNDLPGTFHPTPEDAWEKGCRWPVSVRLKIPPDWRSGFYLISAAPGEGATPHTTAYAFVVVRAPQPTAKILLVHPTNTYVAYNTYGGASLYVRRQYDTADTGLSGGEHRVSLLRPWMPGLLWKDYRPEAESTYPADWDDRHISPSRGIESWSNVAGFHNWDRVLIEWLEQNGYAYDCAISSDLEAHPQLLGRYRLLLSVGHDEYWSWGMRDTVESFVAQGGNACFFSGNLGWQVRYEDQGQSMVCYKNWVERDPLFHTVDRRHLTATYWDGPIVDRPTSRMTGLNIFYGGYARFGGSSPHGPGGYLVYRPEHWVFKDSGVTYGDCLGMGGKIVHFETDGCPIRFERGLPYPAKEYDGPASMEILGLCPTNWGVVPPTMVEWFKKFLGERSPLTQALIDNRGHAVMGIYTNKGTVFTAGTCDWTQGLTGQDRAVEQVTRNLLNRLSV